MPSAESERESGLGRYAWLVLLLILLAIAAVRWRLLGVPLERDEGEYAYNAQLLLGGVTPYRLAHASQKLPGASLCAALALALWSKLPHGLHFGLLLVNLASASLLFALVRRLAGDTAGLVAAGVFGLLAVGQGVLGFAAHATHFVIAPMLGGLLVLLGALERDGATKRLFAAGALLGLAIVARQPSAAFALFGAALLALSDRRRGATWSACARRQLPFGIGVVTPFAVLCLWLWSAGVFPTFWFWTFEYARSYGSQKSLTGGLEALRLQLPVVTQGAVPLWLAALAGAAVLCVRRGLAATVFAGWSAAALLAVSAGLYFREHYFVQLLPVVAGLVGVAATGPGSSSHVARHWKRVGPLAAFVLVAACAVAQREYLFVRAPRDISRVAYAGNFFVEVEDLARELKARSAPSDEVVVLGSEPQLYAYAGRRSATPFIYTYALMEDSPFAERFQREFCQAVETAAPRFIVFVQSPFSWAPRRTSRTRVFAWASTYLPDHYDLIGVVRAGDEVRLGGAGLARPGRSTPHLAIYERR